MSSAAPKKDAVSDEKHERIPVPDKKHMVNEALPAHVPCNRVLTGVLTAHATEDNYIEAQTGPGLHSLDQKGDIMSILLNLFWDSNSFMAAFRFHRNMPSRKFTLKDRMIWQKYSLLVVQLPAREHGGATIPFWIDPVLLPALWKMHCEFFVDQMIIDHRADIPDLRKSYIECIECMLRFDIDPDTGAGSVERRT